jgi:peptidoglycan/xylan/chitin deacetylase (PgdA/CDA1 family)
MTTQFTSGPGVALTFEAGGDPAPTQPILEALRAAGVQATFFLDGQWAEAHADLVRQMATDGHELGNHGYHHPDWTTLTDEEIRADLRATEDFVRKLTGREVKPWARPPFGAINTRVLEVLSQAGYHAVYRDAVDGGHWPGETNAGSIYQRTIQSATDGAVIVFHTNHIETAQTLPRILADLNQVGFRLGTLSALGRVPSPRLERHPDFANLAVNPGYIRPRAAGRWQSLSLLEMGALAKRQHNLAERVAELDGTVLELLTGDRTTPLNQAMAVDDCYILVLAGELRCDFRDGADHDLGYLVARTGDFFRCPQGTRYRLGPVSEEACRWIVAIWRTAGSLQD